MNELRKNYTILSLLVLILSGLLILNVFFKIYSSKISVIWVSYNLLDLIWPIMGFGIIFEFSRKDIDKWGFGGLLFHFFILYCAIYYLILFFQILLNFSFQLYIIFELIIYIMISILGWIGFLYYYD
ncbi:MAG: hypothetical protein ACP6IY_19970 [Promethearchaeia archaeon]